MKTRYFLLALASALFLVAMAEQHREGWRSQDVMSATFKADRVAVDNVTQSAVASGHVHAVVGVVTIRGEMMERNEEGLAVFHNPTCVTTCSNDVGHTHWNVTGEVQYKKSDFVLVRNAWLRFYEVPVFYLPYLYYSLDTDCGFSWMPGYTGSWGAYLLTRYKYNLLGDSQHRENTWWLTGSTDFDIRYRQGLAVGENLDWNLGDFGKGAFNIYYAWDRNVSSYDSLGMTPEANWGTSIPENRYGFSFSHRWNPTERDSVFIRASRYSDSYFRSEFMRRSMFEIRNQWVDYRNSGATWEHVENAWAFGVEASGRLNDFYSATERLPEFYLDLNPTPIFDLPLNYESENRVGWLARRYAEYARGRRSIFGTNPGPWCDYEAFRLDTYHRVTAPFKLADDVLAIVPRIGYRGTLWSNGGLSDYQGKDATVEQGQMFRSIIEGGTTFSARGTAWIDDLWAHMVEPYFDVLAQEAYYDGRSTDSRPYVFDALDASMAWEDQFAGRGRNLPYSYYGVTPGLRNAWSKLDESGNLRQIVDFDVYAALSFGKTHFEGDRTYGDYDSHKLADPGKGNYGKRDTYVSPGFRLRWTPAEDIMLMTRAEYDSDYNTVALGDFSWMQKVSKQFSYSATYALRDTRYWDFSSSPYDAREMREDSFNWINLHTVRLGCEYQPVDWFAFGPYIRWDLRENELDCVGAWFDYLTDCLGFRFIVDYENECVRSDGYRYDEDWSFGFYIYLRAFGPSSGSVFMGR